MPQQDHPPHTILGVVFKCRVEFCTNDEIIGRSTPRVELQVEARSFGLQLQGPSSIDSILDVMRKASIRYSMQAVLNYAPIVEHS